MSTQQQIDALCKIYSGPMTTAEVELLRDVQGFIDFAIRNGLSFALVVGSLGHDMNNLARFGFDLDQAKVEGFEPKVAGYSQAGSEAIGDADEASEV